MSSARLRDLLSEYFNKSELRNLCHDLEVNHENLAGDTLNDLARELIEYCFRHKQIKKLVNRCQELRPNVSWPDPQLFSNRSQKKDYLTSNLATALKQHDYPDPQLFSNRSQKKDYLTSNLATALKQHDYLECVRIFETIKQKESPTAEAYCYLALAILSGRYFNSISPREREQIEVYLNLGRNKQPEWMLPFVLLAVLEIDYYEIHGMVSDNDINVYDVAQEIRNRPLTIEDCEYLKFVKISPDAVQQLNLDTHYS